jgi:hypothetical protein
MSSTTEARRKNFRTFWEKISGVKLPFGRLVYPDATPKAIVMFPYEIAC